VSIIYNFTRSLEPGEGREIVAGRGRIRFKATGVIDRQRVNEYTRYPPRSWRPIILDRYSYQCAICQADLNKVRFEMDHIRPFALGGKRVLENFQPLCRGCNRKKGKKPMSLMVSKT
jgi:5-methylcytosine-specific restriction endonuclease McrA